MIQNNANWVQGLCDSEIIDIRKEDYIYDYRQKTPIRNMLELIIDSNQAMSGTYVKSIRFYNYKIISGGEEIIHSWWYKDEISENNGLKKLVLTLRHSKDKCSEFVVTFDKVEIVK